MSIFTLDEDLSRLTVNGSCALVDEEDVDDCDVTSYDGTEWHKNLLSSVEPQAIRPQITMEATTGTNLSPRPNEKPTGRRRSSLYDKMSVQTPPNAKRVVLATEECENGKESRSSSYCRPSSLKKHGPRCLDDFKPVRVLGRGAYGKVLLVKDQFTSRLYAMKQLKKAEILISDCDDVGDSKPTDNVDKRLERTFAERTILSKLDHPNIVKLFYSFHDHHKLYLVLEFIPGGELFYHLKEQGTLGEDTVAFYAAEISSALRFLHQTGIVYRDLKPENCLLNENGHLVLTDFGLSKNGHSGSADGDDHTGEDVSTLHSIIGTPEYCAPEILEGKPYTQSCDWYSLGCLIYDMLIGKPPYTGANHKVILGKILRDKTPKIPSYLSDGMKDFLAALLKKDVSKRWDVDKYWDTDGPKPRKKKAGQAKTTSFKSHFVFRKINWDERQLSQAQKLLCGPIVPVITNWELAENFDTEFTDMPLGSLEDTATGIDIRNPNMTHKDVFKGFSYVASSSYLDRYF
ncbi:LAMI_0B05908g1_1 [Lachancea mirantina]|uniref:LAMI_0B05908g1_1 n=1 Tax=Lachancea mirantina TaxID=1230905 RepID=A0A1G4IW71_9SACH|nr:LAMI_0B05908g1_1 [Lachancea mirantina]